MRGISWLFVGGFLVLSLFTVYANVLSDDAAIRARAEKLARQTMGCGDTCKLTRTEGTRGVFKEMITYTFAGSSDVVVTCRRPYIAFGDYSCEASKP